MDLFKELFQVSDEIRRNMLDSLGPLAPMVTAGGQILMAAIAFIALASGWSFWAPPTELRNYPVRMAGLIAGVGLVALYVWSKNEGTPIDFLLVAGVAIIIGAIAGTVYFYRWTSLSFKCEDDPARYVRGLQLTENASKVLAGNIKDVPSDYISIGESRPTNERDYFCRSGKVSDRIWEHESHVRAQMRLVTSYVIFMVPIVIGLASAGIALSQPEIKVGDRILSLPGDVLFDLDKYDLRPGAVVTLEEVAKIMRKRKVTAARIEGHTDSTGKDAYNKDLSKRRAEAVKDWLARQDGLSNVKFTTDGRGATQPVESNDTPEGRAKNRRVTIVLDK
ncbi:outer membrane protein OmpA-like peptidoglycan-associated protein [Bradyrhizobium sp. AZCC 1610]|uniref:OmpA family protein n=1 Tax=Bradyrhizobium sp. AZCC 1610 TaxID=3117020 RepID=UPI002FF2A76C